MQKICDAPVINAKWPPYDKQVTKVQSICEKLHLNEPTEVHKPAPPKAVCLCVCAHACVCVCFGVFESNNRARTTTHRVWSCVFQWPKLASLNYQYINRTYFAMAIRVVQQGGPLMETLWIYCKLSSNFKSLYSLDLPNPYHSKKWIILSTWIVIAAIHFNFFNKYSKEKNMFSNQQFNVE